MNNSTDHFSGKAYDVFLCYSSEDRAEVRQIYEALQVRGVNPWIDEMDLRPGDLWQRAIEAALEGMDTAAVFIGKAHGRVQAREMGLCIDLESRHKLRIIPVILPGCPDDSEIEGFLRNYSWVDFRQPGSDPLGQLCSGIGKVEPRPLPVIAVAPTTTSDARSRLIVYCQNAGLFVPRAGIYPADTDSALKAFAADLEYCHVVVQLDEPASAETSNENLTAITKTLSVYKPQKRVMYWKPGGTTQSEFQKEVVYRARRAFDAIRLDPDMEPSQDEPQPAGFEAAQKWAMVKYDRVDAKATREMLRILKEANIRCTSSPNGSTTLAQRLRENPFDALILVLGNCDDDWLERRIDELIEVELTLKDQSPLQAYYYAEGATAVPPDISPSTLEVEGADELDNLVQAIRGGPA